MTKRLTERDWARRIYEAGHTKFPCLDNESLSFCMNVASLVPRKPRKGFVDDNGIFIENSKYAAECEQFVASVQQLYS